MLQKELENKDSGASTPKELVAADSTEDEVLVAPPPDLVPAETSPPGLRTFYTSRNHPFNKLNFRYLSCGPVAGVPSAFRLVESAPQCVRFDWQDRSARVNITEDAASITTPEKGWRGARANVPIRQGSYYWEVRIDVADAAAESHVRVGIGRRESSLNVPVGYDGHSYAYRDKTGEALTLSTPMPYGRPFRSGSVVGVCVELPPRRPPVDRRDPARLVRKRIPIKYKGQMYFELAEYTASREMRALMSHGDGSVEATENDEPRPLPRLTGSRVSFYLDGESQGVAFSDLYDFLPLRTRPHTGRKRARATATALENHHDDGTLGYYPFVSVYGGGVATLNPGPHFAHPPPEGSRPLSERYAEYLAEQAFLDRVDAEEHARRLALNDEDEPAAIVSRDSPADFGAKRTKSTREDTEDSGADLHERLGSKLSHEIVKDSIPGEGPEAGPEGKQQEGVEFDSSIIKEE